MSNSIVALNSGAIKVRSFQSYGGGNKIKINSNLNLSGNLTVSDKLTILSTNESVDSIRVV